MTIQCPDCQRKLKPRPPADTKEGTRVVVKCPCGTPLRFRMPGKPEVVASNYFADLAEAMSKIKP